MRSVLVKLEVGLDGRPRLPTAFDRVFELVVGAPFGNEAPSEPPPAGLPIRLSLPSIRVICEVHQRRVSVSSYAKSSWEAQCLEIAQMYRKLEPLLKDVPMFHARLVSHWISPVASTWKQLLSQYAEAFLRPGAVSEDVRDCSVLLDLAGEGWSGRLQTGPMERKQLIDVLEDVIPESEIDDRFLYVAYDYHVTRPQSVEAFVDQALRHVASEVETINTAFGEVRRT